MARGSPPHWVERRAIMTERWNITIRVSSSEVKVLVTDRTGNELLKGRLPIFVSHPRALLTVLEGLALWCGGPLTAVTSVAESVPTGFACDVLSVDFWADHTPLIRFEHVQKRKRRPQRIEMGDFRELHRMERLGGTR
jgi:hypothetical protein